MATKVTRPNAASTASGVMRSKDSGGKSKGASASAVSQVAPQKVTSKAVASDASDVMKDKRTSAASKTGAASALSQRPASAKRK